jgi:hypothetical protein
LVGLCFGRVAFLCAMVLLEDFTTKNTAKDNKYLIKCCEFFKVSKVILIYILATSLIFSVIRREGRLSLKGPNTFGHTT